MVGICSMSEICVVHLVRRKNGIEPFRRFLKSYLGNSAGVDHELLILYKGFFREADIIPYEELLRDVPHSFLRIADFGFDLRSYFKAAEESRSKYCCFLNSFSIILDKDWLLKLYQHINQPDVGIAGVTGSWGSISRRRVWNKENISYWIQFLRKIRKVILSRYFDAFPNYHIRTNSFIISRDIMLRIHQGVILTKIQAYYLESGKNGITKQVEKMGLKLLVVGRDGRGYEKHEWDISNTFWHGKQENLLISDNQTRKYDRGDLVWRQKWERFAWGETAEISIEQ